MLTMMACLNLEMNKKKVKKFGFLDQTDKYLDCSPIVGPLNFCRGWVTSSNPVAPTRN